MIQNTYCVLSYYNVEQGGSFDHNCCQTLFKLSSKPKMEVQVKKKFKQSLVRNTDGWVMEWGKEKNDGPLFYYPTVDIIEYTHFPLHLPVSREEEIEGPLRGIELRRGGSPWTSRALGALGASELCGPSWTLADHREADDSPHTSTWSQQLLLLQ
ncbi:Hypothetical_protein [Hexamita inflata]|uniref:Hypothetical_protein n=1 Tax=Hexamita inflata TaxID=28002 RepID=A0AA86Q835_9EUKA|nr:Hypothetical protein HINF_LOCUS40678 [Hexamita inflata]